jgi:RNA polymerase sigma-70 factor (ECF subfamily)
MATSMSLAGQSGPAAGATAALERRAGTGLRDGTSAAFERLYEAYRGPIFNLALRVVRSREDACDITQEVFLKAYRQLPEDSDLKIRPWLYRVAVNACYDHLRTRKVHSELELVQCRARNTHIDAFEQAELSRQLEQTLAALSTRHRTVLLLKDIHGLRHDEIAAILDVSRGATETLLFRARKAFRRQYAELARELPPGSRDARRVAVDTWGVAAVGLGLFLPSAPLPAALRAPFSPVVGGASAAGTGAAAGMAAGAAAGGAAAGAGSLSLNALGGGLAAKLGAMLSVKLAAGALATVCAVGATGAVAYEASSSRNHAAGGGSGHGAVAAAIAASHTQSTAARSKEHASATAGANRRSAAAVAAKARAGAPKAARTGAVNTPRAGGRAGGRSSRKGDGVAPAHAPAKAARAAPPKPAPATTPVKLDKLAAPSRPDTAAEPEAPAAVSAAG